MDGLFLFHQGLLMSYLAPGAEAISEFARQRSGAWLTGTCVQASAEMDAVALSPQLTPDPSAIGDLLQQMVNEWSAEFPGDVSPSGASNFVDAADWLRDQGFNVIDDVLPDVPDWFAEMQTNIPRGCVYLVGVTNAQALPGDEPGVQNHGLAALGVDDAGNIICGDPDNWRANVNMPGNPVGQFVTYTRADFSNAAISSLTKVWGKSMWTKQADGWSTDSAGHRAGPGVIGWMTGNGLIAHDALAGESPYSPPDANGKEYAWLGLDDGTVVVVTREGNTYSYSDHISSFVAVGIEAQRVATQVEVDTLKAQLAAVPPTPTPVVVQPNPDQVLGGQIVGLIRSIQPLT